MGKAKQGAAFGYTKVLGYHPILATRADAGEVCHARMRKGSANTARGARRFIDELVARLRRAGASGEMVMRFDSGFRSKDTIATLRALDVRYTMAVRTNTAGIAAAIGAAQRRLWPDWRHFGFLTDLTEDATSGSSPTSPRTSPPSTSSTATTPPSNWPSAT